MKQYTYLIIDLACIFVPFIASFYPKHAFYKEWKWFFPANLLVAAFFLIWDYLFTDMKIWGFNPDYLTGWYIGNLPIEEVLFFICIPYACVFTYFAFKYLIHNNPLKAQHRKLSLLLAVGLLGLGLWGLPRWYTSTTFLLTAAYLGYCLFVKKDLAFAYLAYFSILPFFFASNGLLTGSFLEAPIVWYDHTENLDFRLGTIPVEDSIYGLLLILWNIDLYEYFKNKNHKNR